MRGSFVLGCEDFFSCSILLPFLGVRSMYFLFHSSMPLCGAGEVVLKGFMFFDAGSCLSGLDQLSLVAQLQIYPRLQFL